jgi:putative ABC transport system permease protein
MNTITDGIDRSFDESLSMLGRNVVYIEKWPWGLGGGEYKWWEYRNRPEMKLEYVDQLRERSRYAEDVAAAASRNRPIRYQDSFIEGVEVVGATANYLKPTALEVEDGRFFSEDDNTRGAYFIVIGGEVAETLFPMENPLGKEVRVQGKRFQVIGVFKKQGSSFGMENVDNMAVMPINTYRNIFGLRWGLQLSVRFEDEMALQEGQYEIEGIMRQIRQLDIMEDNNFAVNKPELFKAEFDRMTSIIYLIGIFLTGLALFVGGIGVMNIMFVSVKERTKEIGIRKAVGAKSWEILFQFLIEAIVLCLIGGVIGVLLSLGTTKLINEFFVAYMSWTTVLNAVIICSIVGVLFGFIPSYKAAAADPIDSLRYE